MPYSSVEAQPLGFVQSQPLTHTYGRHVYILVMVICTCQECINWLLPPLLQLGGKPSAAQFSSSNSNYLVGIQLWRLSRESPDPMPSLHGWKGSSFPHLVPPDDAVNSESVVGIKPGDSGVVIGYQVDEFICTWSTEQFVAHSHIYPGFMVKVSSLTHFALEQGFGDYSFLDQAVTDFEQGLDSILTSLIVSRHWNWIQTWMSLMLLLLQSFQGYSA